MRTAPTAGSQVINDFDPGDNLRQHDRVSDRTGLKTKPGMRRHGGKVRLFSRRKIVEHDHLVAECKQPLGQVTANETGAAGHQTSRHSVNSPLE